MNKPSEIKETIHAKHVFTQDELLELSRSLGRTCSEISTLEAEKSACTKDFGFRIEIKEILRDSLVDKVTSGYEMRPTECVVVLDPANRSKDYFRPLTGEFLERREMTTADFQLSIPMDDEKGTVTISTDEKSVTVPVGTLSKLASGLKKTKP